MSLRKRPSTVERAQVETPPPARKRRKVGKKTAVEPINDEDAPSLSRVDTINLAEAIEVSEPSEPPVKKGKARIKAALSEPVLSDYKERVVNEWKVGVHVSTAGGIENSVTHAASCGANSFALFLKSNRKWQSPPLTEESISKFKSRIKSLEYDPSLILPHSTYLINMANPDDEKREKAYECFADDLRRCEQLGLTLCNFHPGSTVGQASKETCIENIANCLNRAHKEFPTVITVIECMAGTKNVLGSTFQELADIINLIEDKSLVGICLDTCHMFAAGLDIRTKDIYEKTMSDFDSVVGFRYLKGFHFNDSKGDLGCKKDRHENIGVGKLGIASFGHILCDPRTKNLPLILETPGFDLSSVWTKEIDVLNRLCMGMQSRSEPSQEVLVDEVKLAIKNIEADGWGAKGKVKKGKPAKGKKGKVDEGQSDDEDSYDDE